MATAVNAYTAMNLMEMARRTTPDGNQAVIAEVLNETNPLVQDGPWVEANNVFAHKSVRRSYIPEGSWRMLNAGVGIGATRTREVVDTIGMLEIYSENDVDLIKSFPNPKQARMDEARGFIEGLSQHLVATGIYGNTDTAPEEINGFATRMGSLATTTNVRNAGGGGSDLTSIYIPITNGI